MIIQTIVDVLLATEQVADLVQDRVFPGMMPDASNFPNIVITLAAGSANYANGKDSNLDQSRIQVDCYSDKGYAAVVELKSRVVAKLSGFTMCARSGFPCAIDSSRLITDMDMAVPATERAGPRLRRRVLEFAVFSKELNR